MLQTQTYIYKTRIDMHYIYIDKYYIYFWPFVSRQFTSDLWLTNTWTAPVLPSVAARWNLEMKQMTFSRVPQDVYRVPTGCIQGPHRKSIMKFPDFPWYIIKFPDSFSVENIVKYKYSSPTCSIWRATTQYSWWIYVKHFMTMWIFMTFCFISYED